MYDLKDSGKRETFETGSRRDTNEGKPRYDLLSLPALERVAEICRKGAQKYGAQNWRLGQPVSRYYESGLRHLMQWAQGQNDEDHLAQAVWNLMAIMQVEYDVNDGMLDEDLLDHERYDRQRFFEDLGDKYADEGTDRMSFEFRPVEWAYDNVQITFYRQETIDAIIKSLQDWHDSFDGKIVRWPTEPELAALARDLLPVTDEEWDSVIGLIERDGVDEISTYRDSLGNNRYYLDARL